MVMELFRKNKTAADWVDENGCHPLGDAHRMNRVFERLGSSFRVHDGDNIGSGLSAAFMALLDRIERLENAAKDK